MRTQKPVNVTPISQIFLEQTTPTITAFVLLTSQRRRCSIRNGTVLQCAYKNTSELITQLPGLFSCRGCYMFHCLVY